jgi:hypothetical protein
VRPVARRAKPKGELATDGSNYPSPRGLRIRGLIPHATADLMADISPTILTYQLDRYESAGAVSALDARRCHAAVDFTFSRGCWRGNASAR